MTDVSRDPSATTLTEGLHAMLFARAVTGSRRRRTPIFPAEAEPLQEAWHSTGPAEVLRRLETSEAGLSASEAERRLVAHGRNRMPPQQRRSAIARLLAQFNNTLIYFLLIGAVAAWLLDHVVDAAVIVTVVFLNAFIGFVQEGRAEQALREIQGLIAPRASVIRDGLRASIAVEELVPGDIVLLEAGDRVPSDIRLLSCRRLMIDEALLTGESLAADKDVQSVAAAAPIGDRRNMAFSGTLILSGQGHGVTVATGDSTQIGHISRLIRSVEPAATPLLDQIEHFARRFTWVVLAGALLLFAFAVFARGYDWVDALIAVVALAVGIVPEGLPAVITVTLAIGVRRMAARNAVIRKLPAVETLGATSVICTDKTGTLTRNEMTARRVFTAAGAEWIASGAGYAPAGNLRPTKSQNPVADLLELVRCGLLCNDASLVMHDGHWSVAGDPMEGALITLGLKAGIDSLPLRAEFPRLDALPFDPGQRFMASLHRHPDGQVTAYVKGAPEALFAMEAHDVRIDEWNRRIGVAAAVGERVLGFGIKRFDCAKVHLSPEDLREGVRFLGLISFVDPPRPEAVQAVAECRSAGIWVKMITGDHAATALAIGKQIGLADDPKVLTGIELDSIADEDLPGLVTGVSIFARTSPEHKLRIVRSLQANRETVAMTGDGVNDAPALEQADVGVAMGIKGTEATKEVAEMVLLDDNFASIVAAVREGRTVYDNIRKVISWELPTNGGETLAVAVAILIGFELPMTATQILWSNLVMAGTLGIALAFEPAEPGLMQRPPRRRDAPLLPHLLLWRIAFVSMLLAAAALGIFFHALHVGHDLAYARTMVVNVLVVCEIFYLFNVRYLHVTSLGLRAALGTPAVLVAIVLLATAQLVFTYTPMMNEIFGSRPLAILDGFMMLGVGVFLMVLLEAEKWLIRRMDWFTEGNEHRLAGAQGKFGFRL